MNKNVNSERQSDQAQEVGGWSKTDEGIVAEEDGLGGQVVDKQTIQPDQWIWLVMSFPQLPSLGLQ